MRIESIEIIRRHGGAAVLLNTAGIYNMRMLHLSGQELDIDLKHFPFQSIVTASWFYFEIDTNAIPDSFNNEMESYLNNVSDARSIRFIANNGKTALINLPWLGKTEIINEAVNVHQNSSSDRVVFEAGFHIV